MATFLRRKLGKMMEKDLTPPSLTISRPEGSVVFSKKELQRYSWLFTLVDSDADDAVGGAEGALFLRRSALGNEQLREVWRLASGGTSKQKLDKNDWLVACKLVAATQHKGVDPSMASVVSSTPIPLANFHYDIDPDVEIDMPTEVAADAVSVVVGSPTTYGTGLAKHTRYNVQTKTTLTQFPKKEMSVWRRYSDFEWLHKRLSTVYPAAIIPLFPEKKYVGNTDEAFVAARTSALEQYMDKAAHHPALSQSLDLLVFLEASDAGLEAAKSYIEAVEAEESESLLVKGVDMVMTISGTQVAPPLVLKADEAFVQACAAHGAALARLNQVVKTGTLLHEAQNRAADTMGDLSKAMEALAEHERTHADAGSVTAAAAAAAASTSKAATAVLFTGSSGGGGTMFSGSVGGSGDAAAAAAFTAHAAAAGGSGAGPKDISAMFSNEALSDPYSALAAASAPSAAASTAKPTAAATAPGVGRDLPALLTSIAEVLKTSSVTRSEQLAELQDSLLKPIKSERDREAELGEAIKRRDMAIDKVQEANMTVQRKKRAAASLKMTAPDFAARSVVAQGVVEKAEKALAARKEDLERMTEVLKTEMARVARARRSGTVNRLAEYVRLQALQARARQTEWVNVLPSLTASTAAIDASRESVAAVARKAETKARAASAAKSKGGAGAAAAAAAAAAAGSPGGSGGAGATPSDTSNTGLFADSAPIPNASEL